MEPYRFNRRDSHFVFLAMCTLLLATLASNDEEAETEIEHMLRQAKRDEEYQKMQLQVQQQQLQMQQQQMQMQQQQMFLNMIQHLPTPERQEAVKEQMQHEMLLQEIQHLPAPKRREAVKEQHDKMLGQEKPAKRHRGENTAHRSLEDAFNGNGKGGYEVVQFQLDTDSSSVDDILD